MIFLYFLDTCNALNFANIFILNIIPHNGPHHLEVGSIKERLQENEISVNPPVARSRTRLEIIYWNLNRFSCFQIMYVLKQCVIICQPWI